MNRLNKTKKAMLSLCLVLCISFIIFLSNFYIITHTGHICLEDSCTVCLELQNSMQRLKALGNSNLAAAVLLISFLAILAAAEVTAGFLIVQQTSLVHLKVRMDH